jgi:hypothetical protein
MNGIVIVKEGIINWFGQVSDFVLSTKDFTEPD